MTVNLPHLGARVGQSLLLTHTRRESGGVRAHARTHARDAHARVTHTGERAIPECRGSVKGASDDFRAFGTSYKLLLSCTVICVINEEFLKYQMREKVNYFGTYI